jgi:hypothetical protein
MTPLTPIVIVTMGFTCQPLSCWMNGLYLLSFSPFYMLGIVMTIGEINELDGDGVVGGSEYTHDARP